MNPARTKQIRRTALAALEMAAPYALPDQTLWSHVSDLVRPPLSDVERQETEEFLMGRDFIRPVKDEMDPELKQWVITELGKSLLASL
jgi:hypothetical protein